MINLNKNLYKYILFILIAFLLVFFVFSTNSEKLYYLNIGNSKLKVELALTSKEQIQGLSNRQELKENEGMLFIFDTPGVYHFWMKEMNFPLDMIWFNQEKEIIYIKENAVPESYPETFGPNEDAKYILEVVSGFSKKNNLEIGETFEFLPMI